MAYLKNKRRRSHKYSDDTKNMQDKLLRDVNSIDLKSIDAFWEKMLRYCKMRHYDPSYIEAWKSHRYRLFITMEWIRSAISLLNQDAKLSGVETGGISIVTDLLCEFFPNITWTNTVGDLRISWGIPENCIDFIVCTEIVEHLSDLPEGFQDSFRMTGLKSMLSLAYRTLRSGGILFITTPNVTSVLNIYRILCGNPPMAYNLHVREYTLSELVQQLEELGFLLVEGETIHCNTIDSEIDYRPIVQFLSEYDFDGNDRGDEIFIVVRKP